MSMGQLQNAENEVSKLMNENRNRMADLQSRLKRLESQRDRWFMAKKDLDRLELAQKILGIRLQSVQEALKVARSDSPPSGFSLAGISALHDRYLASREQYSTSLKNAFDRRRGSFDSMGKATPTTEFMSRLVGDAAKYIGDYQLSRIARESESHNLEQKWQELMKEHKFDGHGYTDVTKREQHLRASLLHAMNQNQDNNMNARAFQIITGRAEDQGVMKETSFRAEVLRVLRDAELHSDPNSPAQILKAADIPVFYNAYPWPSEVSSR